MDGAALGTSALTMKAWMSRLLKPLLIVLGAGALVAFTFIVAQERPVKAPLGPVADKPAVPAPRHASRCDDCGVFESIKLVNTGPASPPLYEITVRLRDGSTFLMVDPSPGPWRAGERVKVMRGDAPEE
jgi:hypothetical protein